jgi:hypothetical protein
LNELINNQLITSAWSEYAHGMSVKKHLKLDQHECRLQVRNVWNVTIPQLTIESAIRTVDVNQDKINDIIVGFGTGVDMAKYPQVICQVYFNQSRDDFNGGDDDHSGKLNLN